MATRHIPEGYLLADDFQHLYQLANEAVAQVVFRPFVGHLYVLPNLLFLLLDRAIGVWGVGYFVVMVLLHVAAVALLFGVVRTLTGSARLGGVAASSWGALPLHAGTLNWFSVVGEPLALVLSLWVLYGMVGSAAAGRTMTAGRTAQLGLGLVAAAMSFGTGIAVAMVAPAIAVLLVPRTLRGPGVVGVFGAVPLLVTVIYLACRWSMGSQAPSDPVRLTVMSLGQGAGIAEVVSMFAGLVGVGAGRVIPGPLLPYDLEPGTALTLTLAAGVAALLALGIRYGDAYGRAALFALVLATLAQYAIVAVGRAVLYAMISPTTGLSVAFKEPRYHYATTAFLTGACAVALHALSAGTSVRRRIGRPVTLLWFGIVLMVSVWKPMPAEPRPSVRREVEGFLAEVNARIDRTPPGSAVYIPNRTFVAAGILLAASPELYPGWAATFTVFFGSNVVRGRQVFFVEPDPAVRAAAQRLANSRIASLLVAPEAVPAN